MLEQTQEYKDFIIRYSVTKSGRWAASAEGTNRIFSASADSADQLLKRIKDKIDEGSSYYL